MLWRRLQEAHSVSAFLDVPVRRRAAGRPSNLTYAAMSDVLSPRNSYRSLSVADLLEARDQYHYPLMNKPNVVGTAVGLYLIRKEDPCPDHERTERDLSAVNKTRHREPRTFANSEVREYSWPCVLVLVKDWVAQEGFSGRGGEYRPDQMVPKTLEIKRNGLSVPVCIVKVEPAESSSTNVPDWHWPQGLFGGGMPIVVNSQGVERRAPSGA